MKKRQFIILGVSFAIIMGSFFLSSVLSGMKEVPEKVTPPQPKRYVKTATVFYEDIETDIVAFGRVETAQTLDLLSEVGGRMFQGNVRMKEGINFRKGDLLFQIDDTEAELSLKAEKSTFLKDLAAILPDLKVDYEGNYDNWFQYFSTIDINSDLPALPELKSDKEKTFLATKGIFSSFYNIKRSEVRLKKYKYYAPFDGSFSEIVYESGSFINPGVKIGKIHRSGVHELRVSVDTKDIPFIQKEAECTIYSEETETSWTGKVSRISDFVNTSTQSIDVYLAIFPDGKPIYDGQFLQASIPAQTIDDGMTIPRNAIYNGNEVFVLQDTLLRTQKIDVHRVVENEAIFSGLEEGIQIVVEPLINAHNNMVAYKLVNQDVNLELKDKNQLSSRTTKAASGVN